MAYDEDLANRIRALRPGDLDITEMRMFGGLAFLVAGNMAVVASGQGGLLVRVDPEARTSSSRSRTHGRSKSATAPQTANLAETVPETGPSAA